MRVVSIEEGYCALAIAILKNCIPEKAFHLLDTGRATTKPWITPSIISEMREVKKTTSLRKMEELYCMNFTQINRYIHKKI